MKPTIDELERVGLFQSLAYWQQRCEQDRLAPPDGQFSHQKFWFQMWAHGLDPETVRLSMSLIQLSRDAAIGVVRLFTDIVSGKLSQRDFVEDDNPGS